MALTLAPRFRISGFNPPLTDTLAGASPSGTASGSSWLDLSKFNQGRPAAPGHGSSQPPPLPGISMPRLAIEYVGTIPHGG